MILLYIINRGKLMYNNLKLFLTIVLFVNCLFYILFKIYITNKIKKEKYK